MNIEILSFPDPQRNYLEYWELRLNRERVAFVGIYPPLAEKFVVQGLAKFPNPGTKQYIEICDSKEQAKKRAECLLEQIIDNFNK